MVVSGVPSRAPHNEVLTFTYTFTNRGVSDLLDIDNAVLKTTLGTSCNLREFNQEITLIFYIGENGCSINTIEHGGAVIVEVQVTMPTSGEGTHLIVCMLG